MLRERLNDALKSAMKAGSKDEVGTLRLILAALKDRDIAARTADSREGISDADILALLQSMVKQRRESIALYEKGGRLELAEQEQREIEIIEGFLPKQMDEGEVATVVDKVIADLGATSLKDMGGVMGALRERFAGQMDFGKASALVKSRLG
ncbi:MAG: GatB/YqeY domain-containing protein [Rhodospirillales bacterium]|nr:GatB/YqeY domain-containing protein [Rhodospirillales bacterium]MCW8861829.1 GatB/YqeY domain-containing protein [Rhodospirillales bacterium]MCW8951112.1 GatB/YqeY domain-containing protein [Rhodospirillales bacterium]MCW8970537.1 GatB/YqeY domain-containing protein [Rhodospirillales bacterium]MCW9002376.1 GatB/YqeY domain-containing protein [Rhodospirillales bacterium]